MLGEREEMGEKTHNVICDVDFPFSTTINTKPISIKLKQKLLSKKENTIEKKTEKDSYGSLFIRDLQNSIAIGSKSL